MIFLWIPRSPHPHVYEYKVHGTWILVWPHLKNPMINITLLHGGAVYNICRQWRDKGKRSPALMIPKDHTHIHTHMPAHYHVGPAGVMTAWLMFALERSWMGVIGQESLSCILLISASQVCCDRRFNHSFIFIPLIALGRLHHCRRTKWSCIPVAR